MNAYVKAMRAMGVDGKDCNSCQRYLDFDEFGPATAGPTKLAYVCRSCLAADRREHFKCPDNRQRRSVGSKPHMLICGARKRALPKGLPFDLDQHKPEITARVRAGHCEMTGLPFDMGMGRTFDSPSIDRIEPTLGYVYSNIRIILWGMNAALGTWGEDVLRERMKLWIGSDFDARS
jgi:hypothetical protein